ncbi:hypothetical protein BCR34DRAFT_466339, partial [Clohesyomyces aquaticus]
MPLLLAPIIPSDTLSWTKIRTLAYLGPTHKLIHQGPISQSSIHGVAESNKRELEKPHKWHWEIVDTSLCPGPDDPEDNGGRTIAVAVWSMKNVESDSAQPKSRDGDREDEEPPFLPPEIRLEVLSALFTPLRDAQLEIMGGETPYLMLNSLATHPEHRRKGAGKMLVRWGVEMADRLGVQVYLDSTSVARGLYERGGFEVRRVVEFDREAWGGEGVDVH